MLKLDSVSISPFWTSAPAQLSQPESQITFERKETSSAFTPWERLTGQPKSQSLILHILSVPVDGTEPTELYSQTIHVTTFPPAPFPEFFGGLSLASIFFCGVLYLRRKRRNAEGSQPRLTQEKEFTVGQELDSTLLLKDGFVAATHFLISKGENCQFVLQDRGGGVQIARSGMPPKRVTISHPISPGDKIEIGQPEENRGYLFRLLTDGDQYGLEVLEHPIHSNAWVLIPALLLIALTSWIYLA
jgi:hypothetical protein